MNNISSVQNPGALYFNKRLLNKLPAILARPLTIVEAPMGYGKTLAVQEFLRGGLSPQDKVVWTTVLDNNENAFWRDFCRAFGAAFPEAAEEVRGLRDLGYPYDSIRADAVLELIREVKFTSRTIMCVDDYHMLPSQGFGRLCELLARDGLANLHIVLITRNEYIGNKEILQLKGLLDRVGRDAFALSRDEIIAYYACCGVKLEREDADILSTHTAGWISALYLYLLRYLKKGVLEQPEALNALADDVMVAVGRRHIAQDVHDRADGMQVGRHQLFLRRVALQHQQDLALLAHGLLDGGDRRGPADADREHHLGEQHEVAHRHDDHGVGRQRRGRGL